MATVSITGPVVLPDGSTGVPGATLTLQAARALPGTLGGAVMPVVQETRTIGTDGALDSPLPIDAVPGARWLLGVTIGRRPLWSMFFTTPSGDVTVADLIAATYTPTDPGTPTGPSVNVVTLTDVAGVFTLTGATAAEVTLVADATLDLTTLASPGTLLALRVHAAGHTLDVLGQQVTGDATIGLQCWSDGWSLLAAGTSTPPVPTTPPTAGVLSVAVTADTATMSVAGALGGTSALDPLPYSFRYGIETDGVSSWGEWSPWQAEDTLTVTGLAAGTAYAFGRRVRDTAGAVAGESGVVVKSTAGGAPVWTLAAKWTFDGVADGTALTGLAPSTGVGTLVSAAPTGDVQAGRAHLTGGLGNDTTLRLSTVPAIGVAFSFDYDISTADYLSFNVPVGGDPASGFGMFKVDVMPNGTYSPSADARSAGTWTPDPAAPAALPQKGRIRIETFDAGGNVAGRLLAGPAGGTATTVLGTFTTSVGVWADQGTGDRIVINPAARVGAHAYLDNLTIWSAA